MVQRCYTYDGEVQYTYSTGHFNFLLYAFKFRYKSIQVLMRKDESSQLSSVTVPALAIKGGVIQHA